MEESQMNTPKITATLNGEFGNAMSVKATVESALIDLYKGVCAEYNISEFRNDIIVSFDMKPQTNTQVLPTAVKTTPLFSEKTAIVHVDYSNEIFTDATGQPHAKPKLKNVYGAVLTGLIGADMIAKDRFNAQRDEGLKFIARYENQIYFAIASYVTLQRTKNYLVNKMNQIKSIGTFIQRGNGFEVTNPEGYVAVDRLGNAVKLVDRLEFSTANFTVSKNWIKG